MRVFVASTRIKGRAIRYIAHGDERNKHTLFFFHGYGESGSIRSSKKYGPFAWPKMIPRDMFVVYPICPGFCLWDADILVDFIHEVCQRHSGERRLYAAGVSMGGYAIWNIVRRAPTLFDAALIFASGGDAVQQIGLRYVLFDPESLRHAQTRIWAFHGQHDLVVPLSNSKRLVNATPNARLTVFAFKGHTGTMRQAMRHKDMYDWLVNGSP